jgi:hypothetical protein
MPAPSQDLGLFYFQFFEVRDECSFCWYWLNLSTITGLTFFLWVPVQFVRLTSARILFLHGKPNFHGCHGYTNQPNLRIQ